MSTAGTIAEIVTGALLMLFTLIFLLHGGRHIFAFVTQVFPRNGARQGARRRPGGFPLADRLCARDVPGRVRRRGRHRTGLAIMGIPLALPLASLVFLGAFIPLVGAVLTGGLAVDRRADREGVGLRTDHLRAHHRRAAARGARPAAVGDGPRGVTAPARGGPRDHAGGVSAGIVGALLAVPIVAVVNSAMRVLIADDPAAEEAALAADVGPPIDGETDELSKKD